MPKIKMVYTVEVDDDLAKIFEAANERQKNQIMAGSIIADMPLEDALVCLFASLGAKCDEHHINKGKILFEWSERFDKLDEAGF